MALTDGLVCHYLLKDDANDSLGNYNGTAYNGVVFTGQEAVFDGANDYIDCNINGVINHECLSFWVYAFEDYLSANTNYEVIGTANTSHGYNYLAFGQTGAGSDDSTFEMYNYSTGGVVYIEENIPIGWCHIVVQWETDKYVIYLNNVAVTNYRSGSLPKQTLDLQLGRRSYPTYGHCKYANVRCYNGEKDTSFIDDLFSEGAPGQARGSTTLETTASGEPNLYPYGSTTLETTASGDVLPFVYGSTTVEVSSSGNPIAASSILEVNASGNPIAASAALEVSASGEASQGSSYKELFTFKYSIQQSVYKDFSFIYSIEQPKTAIVIKRVNE